MPGDMVKIIIDRVYNKIVPKPINLRPGYDMEHVFNYRPQTDNYRYEKVVEIEKQYDYLSIIRPHETPQQWLIIVHKSQMAICFKCQKLVKITKVEPRKEYYSGWGDGPMSASNFEPACISITSGNQEMVSPTSYQSSNCRSNTSEIFISSLYAKQNNLLPSINYLNRPVLKLDDGTEITIV
ncbi:unnamed protein product [Rhizophagus irregularis]|nr:unnamed protein product [Rhizophagus irregularis]